MTAAAKAKQHRKWYRWVRARIDFWARDWGVSACKCNYHTGFRNGFHHALDLMRGNFDGEEKQT